MKMILRKVYGNKLKKILLARNMLNLPSGNMLLIESLMIQIC